MAIVSFGLSPPSLSFLRPVDPKDDQSIASGLLSLLFLWPIDPKTDRDNFYRTFDDNGDWDKRSTKVGGWTPVATGDRWRLRHA